MQVTVVIATAACLERMIRYGFTNSTNGDARTVSEEASSNVHSCKLLEQQLRGIRDVDLRNSSLVAAGPTLKRLLSKFPSKSKLQQNQLWIR